MKPTQQEEKLKKQSIHSVMTITSMEYHTDFPHIWFSALKLKGGSEVNRSSSQN